MSAFFTHKQLVHDDCHGAAKQTGAERKFNPEDLGVTMKRTSAFFPCLVVVIGSGLATSSEGAEPEMPLAPKDRADELGAG